MPSKTKKSKPSKARRAAGRRKSYYKPKKNFVKSVKAVIHGMSENKMIEVAVGDTDVIPASAAQYTNIALLPNTVNQGVGMHQRIGNEIRIVSNKLRMYFSLNTYSLAANPWQSPIQVCLWVYSFKSLNAYSAQPASVQDLVSNQLFQLNNASTGTTKTVQDLLFATNKEYITLHKRIMFNLNTPTSAASSTGFNSDGKPYRYVSLDLSKYAKKLIYNDTAVGPTNKDLYMLINTYHTDGSVYADTERMVSYTYVQSWSFEDL